MKVIFKIFINKKLTKKFALGNISK